MMNDTRDYPDRPICGVGIVVFFQQKVLPSAGITPTSGRVEHPGGKQILGETLQQAARREVQEETGLRLGPQMLVDLVDLIFKDSQQNIQYHYSLIEWTGEL